MEVSPAGKVYFAVAAAAGAENGLESALRTELLAHTATGCVYVYDPAARTVEKVLGGVQVLPVWRSARTAAPCMSPTLAAGCIWAVDAAAREADRRGTGLHRCLCRSAGLSRSAGCGHGRHAVHQLPLGAQRLAGKERGQHLLRGIALRAGQNTQERLFRCTADAPCAEAVSLATGAWEQTFTGLVQDSCAAVCPVESKVYFGAAGADSLLAANR